MLFVFFLSLFPIPFLSLVLISLSGFEVFLECVWTAHGSVFDVCVWPAANPPFPCFSAFSACPVSDPWLHHNCLYKSPPISSSSSLTLSAFWCSSPFYGVIMDQTVYISCLIRCPSPSLSLNCWGVVYNQATNLLTEQTARPHATVSSHYTRTCPICGARTLHSKK